MTPQLCSMPRFSSRTPRHERIRTTCWRLAGRSVGDQNI